MVDRFRNKLFYVQLGAFKFLGQNFSCPSACPYDVIYNSFRRKENRTDKVVYTIRLNYKITARKLRAIKIFSFKTFQQLI